MGIEDIRRKYDINATIGTRVKFCGRFGSITGTSGLYLKIKLDGDKVSGVYHPTWNIFHEFNGEVDMNFITSEGMDAISEILDEVKSSGVSA